MRCLSLPVDSLITASAQPPIEVAYAKKHIRSLTNREDDLILAWILGAASYFEEQTGRQIMTATRELWLDTFPCVMSWGSAGTGGRIELPHPPLQSVVSVHYIDSTGALQAFSDGLSPETVSYQVRAPAGPYAVRGWVEPLSGLTWPTAREETGAVRIQYTAGYGDTPDDVPELIRAILCYLVGHFDAYRAAVVEPRGALMAVPFGVQMMLDGFKYSALPSMATT